MKKGRKIVVFSLIILSIVLLIGAMSFLWVTFDDAKLNANALPTEKKRFLYLDKNGETLKGGDYVTIDKISKHIQNAFIAIEDKRFYTHNGIDQKRLIGAAINNIKTKSFSQGGSTISNQLIKNTHLDGEKTFKRKLKEAKITLELEKNYSKEQILEMYLNVIYFGKGIYGVKNACEILYHKSPMDVSPVEAASLAATVANPSKFSAIKDYNQNLQRTRLVLSLMHSEKYLTDAEYVNAIDGNIIINYSNSDSNCVDFYVKSTYFEAKQILSDKSVSVFKAPYQVYTYFDPIIQMAITEAMQSYENKAQKEIIVADNKSREIVAYASTDPATFDLKRQPGSLLKPFLYAKAIDLGKLLPDSPVLDQEIEINGYKPNNYGKDYAGWITARDALSNSKNTVAVKLLYDLGVDTAINTLQNTGIKLSDKDKTLSLALGGTTYGSSMSELVEGYLTLANQGKHAKTAFIEKIVDANGKIVYQNPMEEAQVFSPEAAYLTTDMLKTAAQSGTAKQLRYLPYEIAAKTGTVAATCGNSDAWCAAYTSIHTFVCRFSGIERSMDDSVTGGNLPTKTIRSAMKNVYKDHLPVDIDRPATLKMATIDKTIKETFHKLVPYKNCGFGVEESIYITKNYQFDAVDPEVLLLGGLKTQTVEDFLCVTFTPFDGVDYEVYLNGKRCQKQNDLYFAEKDRFPIAKLQILCKKNGAMLWKTTRLISLF